MKHIGKTFLAGLAAILPAAASLYSIYWLLSTSERLLGHLLRLWLPAERYVPGMGLAAGILVIFLVGLLMYAWVIRKIFAWAEGLFCRLPLVRSIYGAVRDLMHFVSSPAGAGHQVVMVRPAGLDAEVMGLVTRGDGRPLPPEVGTPDQVAVYLPLSYQIGGLMLVVPRTAVRPVAMPVEDALRFALTAGLTSPPRTPPARKPPAPSP